jgi:hypothetical protein
LRVGAVTTAMSFGQITNGGWISGVISNLTSDNGLSETSLASVIYQLAATQGPWASGDDDINSVVEFDLGRHRRSIVSGLELQ